MRLDSRWVILVLALTFGACGKTTDSEPNVGTSGGGGMPSGEAGTSAGAGESGAGGTGGVLVLEPWDSGTPGEPDGGWYVERYCAEAEELLGEEFSLTLRIGEMEWRLTEGAQEVGYPTSPPVLVWGRVLESGSAITVLASDSSVGLSLYMPGAYRPGDELTGAEFRVGIAFEDEAPYGASRSGSAIVNLTTFTGSLAEGNFSGELSEADAGAALLIEGEFRVCSIRWALYAVSN